MEDRDINLFLKNHNFYFKLVFHDTFTVSLVNISYLFIAFETLHSLQQ